MPDTTVDSLLNEVWSYFRIVGISNDFDIIEYLAALLTENQSSPTEDLRPRMPPNRPGLDLGSIRSKLTYAVTVAGNSATLFDRYIIFRLRDRLPDRGGHYPTPRHIVQFMRHLVQLESNHRLADFACGTGGFLVSRGPDDIQPETIAGVDNAPEWAHLAWANTTLHGNTAATIYIDDPLRLYLPGEKLADEQFDRVLMNPPFGATIDAGVAKEVLGFETGGNSETALTSLAFHVLAEEGRAAVLVPTGLLFGKNTGEQRLRERLVGTLDGQANIVGDYQLDAVISLPKDALQPYYGSTQTHVLLARKKKAEQVSSPAHAIWLFQTEKDGYPAGRKRDITTPPGTNPEQNDLPFVEVLLTQTNFTGTQYTFSLDGQSCISIKKVISDEIFLGIVVETLHTMPFSQITYFPTYTPKNREAVPAFFLFEASNAEKTHKLTIKMSVNQADVPDEVSDVAAFLGAVYGGVPENDRPRSETLLQESERVQAIAVAVGDRVLGQAIFPKRIIERDYELQPKEYVRTVGEKKVVEPSALLLGRVRRSQTTFLEQVEGLLGRLELKPIAGLPLPSRVCEEIRPLSGLAQAQEQFWQRICTVSEQRQGTLNGLFTLEDVRSSETRETAQLTLDLFERMGVIVTVTVVDPNKRESLPTILYRRVTERDLWQEQATEKNAVP